MATLIESEMESMFSLFKRHEGNILHNKNISILNSYAVLLDGDSF
jgi:hypothetical protein